MQNKGLGDILLRYVTRLFDEDRLNRGKAYIDRVGKIHKKDDELVTQVIGNSPYRVSIPTIKLPKHSKSFFKHRYAEEMKKSVDDREFFHLGDGSKVDHLFNSYSGHIYGKAKCSCPDEASMCKHIAATLYKIIKDLDITDETLFALIKGYNTSKYSAEDNRTEVVIEEEHEDVLDYFNPLSRLIVDEITASDNNEDSDESIEAKFNWNLLEDLDPLDFTRSIDKIIVDITFRENVDSILYLVNLYRSVYQRDKTNKISKLAIEFTNRDCIYFPEQNVFSFKDRNSDSEVKISVEHIMRYLDSISLEDIQNESSDLIQSLWILKEIGLKALEYKFFQAGIYENSSDAHKIILKPHQKFLKSDECDVYSSFLTPGVFKISENDNTYPIAESRLIEFMASVFMTNELHKSIKEYKYNEFLQSTSGVDGQMSKSLWIDSRQNLIHYSSFVNALYKPSDEWNAAIHLEEYEKDVIFSIHYYHNGTEIDIEEAKGESGTSEFAKKAEKYVRQILKDCGFLLEDGKAKLYLSKLKDISQIKTYISFFDIDIEAADSFFEPEKLEVNMQWDISDQGEQLMDSEIEMSLADNKLNQIPNENLKSYVSSGEGVYEMNDEFYYLDESVLKIIRDYLEAPQKIKGVKMLRSVLMEEYQGHQINFGDHLVSMRNKLFDVQECPIPEEFVDVLRPYQRDGLKWLWKNTQMSLGSLLADDMGLGKTIQLLALLSAMYKVDKNLKALVVVPTAVISNWMSEAERFVPHIPFHAHYGSERDVDDILDHHIIITSYGMVRSDYEKLKNMGWDVLALDEAQKIKNPSTKISRVIKTIPSRVKVALTGTPVENRLLEYWNILDFLNRGMLGTKSWFKRNFAQPIERHGDEYVLKKFVKMTSPFILRRLKTDKNIISDLPDKIVSNEMCDLSDKQRKMYQTYVNEMLKVIEGNEGIKRKGLILKMMTDLKKICNHPKHFDPENSMNTKLSGKLNYMLNLLEIISDNEEKTLIFTQYVTMGKLLQQVLDKEYQKKIGFYHGSLSRTQRDKVLSNFKESEGFDALIISLKAGGTGLNLTEASHVIHYDLWWNPAVEDQATDRAFRIGQDKNVFVQRLISKGTFEEKINKMLQSKRGLADSVLNVESNWIGEMSNEELSELFVLEDKNEKQKEELIEIG